MILADTSAWVEYHRATGSGADRRMTSLIDSDGPLAVSEPVVMEVLAGARNDRREGDVRRLLGRFDLLGFDAVAEFGSAARIHHRCRAAGITPRGMIDCMVAAAAWRRGATLLSFDVHLDRVAQIVGITTDPATLR
jgi:predicted nucleic acid-binding protein